MKVIYSVVTFFILLASGCIYIPSFSGGQSVHPPVIEAFESSPDSIAAGSRSTLSWVVTGAGNVAIDNGIGAVALKGTRSVTPSTSTVYTLTATNAAGSATATCQVLVAGVTPMIPAANPPVVNSFTVTPATVSPGGSAVLAWNVANASTAYIDQGIGSIDPVSGSRTVTPSAAMVYKLTAVNLAGSVSAEASVNINIPVPASGPPVINQFEANPTSIPLGGSTNITWNVSNSTQVTMQSSGGAILMVGPAGTVTARPSFTGNYLLVANNASGSVSKTVTVYVGGVGEPQAQGERMTQLSLAASTSGSLIKSGTSYTKSGSVCAGDNTANQASRAFLSFDLTSIPPSAKITEAVLDLSTYSVMGNPTYSNANWGNMGALEFYRVQYGSFADLGRLAYESTASSVGSLKLNDVSGSPLKLDVTQDGSGNNILQQAMDDAQQQIQFRAQFFTSTNWDSKADQICVDGAVLRVKYTLP